MQLLKPLKIKRDLLTKMSADFFTAGGISAEKVVVNVRIGVDKMGESLLEKWMDARIFHILQTSYYMKEDILYRHRQDELSEEDFRPIQDKMPYQEDYSFGWKKIIDDAVIKYWVADGFIFTGPDGCGKHTAAELAYCALEKVNQDFFAFVFLPAKALMFTPLEQKAYEEERIRLMEQGRTDAFTEDIVHYFFECLFRQFPKDQGICLVIDNSEQLEMKAVYDRLGQYMCISQCECRRIEQAGESGEMPLLQNLFIIIIDKEDDNIPSLLYKKLLRMRMSYPTLSQRLTLLKTMGLYDEIANPIAQKTENYNYTQLRNLAKNTQIFSVFDENLDGVFYDEIVRSQISFKWNALSQNKETPVPQLVTATQENGQLAEEKIRLYQKIEQLIENLPEILEKIGTSAILAAPQTVVVPSKNQEEEPLSISQIQKHQESLMQQQPSEEDITSESANMEMNDLLGSVLGQERMKRIGFNGN